MTGWIIGGGYVLGYMSIWRTVAYYIAHGHSHDRIDGTTLVMACFSASVFSLFWPLIVIGLAVRKIYAVRGREIEALIIPRSERRRRSRAALTHRIRENSNEN